MNLEPFAPVEGMCSDHPELVEGQAQHERDFKTNHANSIAQACGLPERACDITSPGDSDDIQQQRH